MIIIVDERKSVSIRGVHPSGDQSRYAVDDKIMRTADLVVMVKQNTYQILKDRYSDDSGLTLPIDEFPEMIKQRIIQDLKQRDDIDDREE
jgi:hypothetical protein